MSLRAFHIVFIIVSIALSLVVAAWGIREFIVGGVISALLVGVAAMLTGTALVVYGTRFFRKLQELR
ncbi:MAG: hypothetical protein O7A04_10640 [Acidobacteria bacterium]|nr:hypothetical protein [Acidobacteriota bacterium]